MSVFYLLYADAVSAGLDDDGVLLHGADGAGDAANAGDLITHSQGVAQVLRFLLPLILGADHEEVEHGEHEDNQNNRFQSCSLQKSSASILLGTSLLL